MALHERGTERLHRGRLSLAGATYFVTACTLYRDRVLVAPATACTAIEALRRLHDSRDADVLAATIMPDHFHSLFTLGDRIGLGQVVGRFKSHVRLMGRVAWKWQEDSFEHRLRPVETTEDYGFYIFMNPYRAGLIPLTQRWAHWFCPNPSRFEFLSHLLPGDPVPAEWVPRSIQFRARLAVCR